MNLSQSVYLKLIHFKVMDIYDILSLVYNIFIFYYDKNLKVVLHLGSYFKNNFIS